MFQLIVYYTIYTMRWIVLAGFRFYIKFKHQNGNFYHRIDPSEPGSKHYPFDTDKIKSITLVSLMNRPYVVILDGLRLIDARQSAKDVTVNTGVGNDKIYLEKGFISSQLYILAGKHEYTYLMAKHAPASSYVEIESGVLNVQADNFLYAKGIDVLQGSADSEKNPDSGEVDFLLFDFSLLVIGSRDDEVTASIVTRNLSTGRLVDLSEHASTLQLAVDSEIEKIQSDFRIPLSAFDDVGSVYEVIFSAHTSDSRISFKNS